MDDLTPFLTKIKRYADVSSTMAGIATRAAAHQTFGYKTDDETYAQALTQALGNMKGPFMKIAQFLATIPDALPTEYTKAFISLQSHAPAMSPYFVKRRLKTEFGDHYESLFSTFDTSPAFAASLGQVHKAVAKDGAILAIKLQYPSMDTIINADLDQLTFFIKTYGLFNKALDLCEVKEEIQSRLHEELDYLNEAQNMIKFRDFFSAHPKKLDIEIHIPQPVQKLTTKRALTMNWVEGRSILDVAENMPPEQRNALGKALFFAWYRPFYIDGMIHGDPHPGNYKVDINGHLHILDFGCVRTFLPQFVDAVILLYEALKERDQDKMKIAYHEWGFTDLTEQALEIMNQWAYLLYDPLLDNRVRPIQNEHSDQKGWQVASEVHQKLNNIGGIKIPREFVFMDRAAVGIGSVLMRLNCQLNWHELFEEILEERKFHTRKKHTEK